MTKRGPYPNGERVLSDLKASRSMTDPDRLLTESEQLVRRARGLKKPEPRIADPATHPKRYVCLLVAAEFLELDARTVRARIDDGAIDAVVNGKVYRVSVASLAAFKAQHLRLAS